MTIRKIFKGPIFEVIQKDVELDGQILSRDLVIHPGGAAISVIDQGKILLVRQYRVGASQEMLEIPAGMIDAGEKPEQAALRELNEETGMEADSLDLLYAFYPTPGYDSEVIYIYKANHPRKASHRLAMDADERIDVVWMDLKEAYSKTLTGEIRDAKTILAIQNEILSSISGQTLSQEK